MPLLSGSSWQVQAGDSQQRLVLGQVTTLGNLDTATVSVGRLGNSLSRLWKTRMQPWQFRSWLKLLQSHNSSLNWDNSDVIINLKGVTDCVLMGLCDITLHYSAPGS